MEESFSVLEEDMGQNPELEDHAHDLSNVTNEMKELVAEILEDFEIA